MEDPKKVPMPEASLDDVAGGAEQITNVHTCSKSPMGLHMWCGTGSDKRCLFCQIAYDHIYK